MYPKNLNKRGNGNSMFDRPRTKRIALLMLFVAVFITTALYLYYKDKHLFTDHAYYGGDIGSYHTLGVNLSRGLGYKVGRTEGMDFRSYKFEVYRHKHQDTSSLMKKIHSFNTATARYSFIRSPGYPFFLACVYKIFGIYPIYVKIIQVLMLAFVSALMPLIGWYYWRTLGIISGLFTVYLFNTHFVTEPWRLMTEPLIIFSLSIWTLFFIIWEKRHGKLETLLLGLSTGGILFVKGSTILMAVFLIFYMLHKIRDRRRLVILLGILFLGIALVVLPWSVYASIKEGSFVFLSTQLASVLFCGNNEDTIDNGSCRYPYREGRDSIYSRPEYKNYSPYKLVFLFMLENKKHLPRMFKNKLKAAFWNHQFYVLYWMLMYYILSYITRSKNVPLFPLICFITALLNTLIFYGSARLTVPFIPFMLLPATYVPCIAGQLVYFKLVKPFFPKRLKHS